MSILSKEAENEVRDLVKDIIDKQAVRLNKEEVTEIVAELIPYLDELVSKNVKKHLSLLGEYLLNNLQE